MAADVGTTLASWSATASSNQPDNSDAVGPNTLAENIRTLQSVVRDAVAGSGTIASATTTDLSTKTENYLAVSGTTTITGLGTVSAGIIKVLKFDGALTFTHNGTSLILPGAANITTAAGDIAIVRSEGSGNWRCLDFIRASGLPVNSSYQLISVNTPTAAANFDRLTDFTSSFSNYRIYLNGVTPNGNDTLLMRLASAGSADTGSNYITRVASAGTTSGTGTSITLTGTLLTSGSSGKGASGYIDVCNANDTARLKAVEWKLTSETSVAGTYGIDNYGSGYIAANAVSGFRLYWSGGSNFAAQGSILVFGLRNS